MEIKGVISPFYKKDFIEKRGEKIPGVYIISPLIKNPGPQKVGFIKSGVSARKFGRTKKRLLPKGAIYIRRG